MCQEKIIVSWDDSLRPEKWRVEVFQMNSEGRYDHVGGSGYGGFPINVDEFGPFDEDHLLQTVRRCFPEAKLCLKL